MAELALLVLLAPSCAAQNCQLASRPVPDWSKQLLAIIGDCNNRIPSPDRKFVLQFGSEGKIRVLTKGRDLVVSGHSDLEPPAMASWSPRSDVFFLNDGEGSGMSSRLRVFYVSDSRAVENWEMNRMIAKAYKQENKCSDSSDDPNVWGLGWSEDGKKMYVMAQTIVGGTCGDTDSFRGYVVDVNTRSLQETLTTTQTKSRFRELLPKNMR